MPSPTQYSRCAVVPCWQQIGYRWRMDPNHLVSQRVHVNGPIVRPMPGNLHIPHGGYFLETLAQDLRHGARSLSRAPGFTVAAVVALSLGIGANSAILSVVSGVLLRPLPYEHHERLVTLLDKGYNPVSPANYLDWKRFAASFAGMGAAEYWTTTITGAGEPEKLYALHLTSDIFPMLGRRPMLGRIWSADEDATGR